MPTRRPDPEGFDEDIALLIDLEAKRAELSKEIEKVFFRLVVEKDASTTTVAERLNVSQPAVSLRRKSLLARRAREASATQQVA